MGLKSLPGTQFLPTRQVDRNQDGKPDDLNGDGAFDERAV
jgi:hypothetical protein